MTNGALIFAHNNASVDYVKLAVFAAERVKHFLNIPVSIATDSKDWLLKMYPDHPFDQIIDITTESTNHKLFYDGSLDFKSLEWKNLSRFRAFDITPYDKTLVLDSDYILNSILAITRRCCKSILRRWWCGSGSTTFCTPKKKSSN
jgi:hypothetical protein